MESLTFIYHVLSVCNLQNIELNIDFPAVAVREWERGMLSDLLGLVVEHRKWKINDIQNNMLGGL